MSCGGISQDFTIMNLLGQAQLAVFRLHKVHTEKDLSDYITAIKYASPTMEAFNIILSNIEELQEKIRLLEENIESILNDADCQ